MALFGSVGAIAWAIRGTGGWDGVDGTLVPGLTWGLLWYYLCWRKGIDARGIPLWLGLGIALGGELGYGQYISWIRGRFEIRSGTIPVAPWIGYAWLALCGIGWGAPGGIILGWALHDKKSFACWFVRSLFFLVLLALLFVSPLIDWLGAHIARSCPWLLFPNAGLGIYRGALDGSLERTVYTNTQNFAAVAWWMGALAAAVLQKDRATLTAGALIGAGFGLVFPLCALWCLGYSRFPDYLDWWKMWELSAGFGLGLLYVGVLYWAVREVDKTHDPTGLPLAMPFERDACSAGRTWYTAIAMTLAVFLFLLFTFLEHFVWMGILLGLLYIIGMVLATRGATANARESAAADERRKSISMAFGVCLLLFILIHGGSARIGALLGLYPLDEMNQYEWPPERILLFALPASAILSATLIAMRRILRSPSSACPVRSITTWLPKRMAGLVILIGLVGAATLWPSKIAVLLSLFACSAIFAFTRMNRRFDAVDASHNSTAPWPH